MPSKTRKGGDIASELPGEQFSEVIIVGNGDVFLEIRDLKTGIDHQYRCSRSILSNASEYFNVLFDPAKFSEGIAIDVKIRKLQNQYDEPIPSSKLPRVYISDVEELPKATYPTNAVITLFLKILHDANTPWPPSRSKSVNLVALLAIVADRFGAHALIASYLRRHTLDVTLLKDKRSATALIREVENRQRLLAGMILGFPQWVSQCSASLIIDGSQIWKTTLLDPSGEDDKEDNDALWWRLPGGVEGKCPEEMLCRREYVLETLGSIQKHFIALYASRQPQCKLGYGSSPNCDSYQLGEIIRFFSRKGLLRIESAFAVTTEEELDSYNGSIEDIIMRFRQCTSYQIDSFHQHCGLRTRLIPLLETLSPRTQVWICLDCWKRDKSNESWLENPLKGDWYWSKKTRSKGGCEAHWDAKAMYTALTRDWTPN